ncbi:hypothetical protein ACFSOZ_01205 [Mesorhizobium newzealandense]|uniref:Glycosyltransferase RgtA/B/C/D-like domain-containing protein n=1 Tax=Mesorhizobium newzealandense TaxID=1300302 RepID=A0ABW4U4M1_9HYPH
MALLLGLLSLLAYNANLRSITAADSYAARYLPFSIWQNHSLTLNPILTTVAQGRKPPATPEKDGTAHWILKVGGDRYVSKFPIVVPVVLSPFYLPAVIYLNHHGGDPLLFDKVARIMEKLCASSLAAVSVGLLYLLLRRRTDEGWAAILSLLYAFGTTTWVISSQALWMHGLAQLLVVATMLLLTGPGTALRVVLAGLLCGLIAANRQPDAILAAGLGIYGLWWAGRMRPLLVLSGMVPVALILAYNLMLVGNVAGAYALHVRPGDFNDSIVGGIAGLLVSPTRGLFVFSPFLLFVPIFCRRVVGERSQRGLAVAVGCAMIVQVLFYAMIDWRQGISWGPRWLTDMLPMLMWMLPPVVKTLSRNGRVTFGLASLVAISIQTIGAFWYTGAADMAIVSTHGPGRMRPAWDIRNAAFIAELAHPHVQADLIVDLRGNIDAVNVPPIGQGTPGEAGRQLEILGWALTNNHSPSDVAVLIDGRPVAGTREFFARADVEKALGQASPAGWRVTIPIDQVTPGEHLLAVLVRATEGGEPRLLKQTSFFLAPDNEALEHVTDLPSAARRAGQMLADHQQAGGYWLTSYTSATRFEQPRQELNTYLNAIMLDVVGPVAEAAGAKVMLAKARQFLAAQIEQTGLVRYHGRPDAPTIGTLGCTITPDSDDTALAWRVAPSEKSELLQPALATITQFRRPDGLYQTWLASRDKYQCLDPGRDPNPADVGIQMHLFLFLEQVDKPAARLLCGALAKKAGDDDIWVYYAGAPLMITLRLADLEKAGCSPQFPQARLRTEIPGQEIWLRAADQLRQVESQAGSYAAYQRTTELLTDIAADDFSLMSHTPPLLYHNDLTATVKRFYWSQDFGYALWLRLYFENERMLSKLPCGSGGSEQKCGEK